MARVVDIHNHVYPTEWIEYLTKRRDSARIERTGPTSMTLYWQDVHITHVSAPGLYDPAARIEDLDKYGIDAQIISLTWPSVELIPAREGTEWARRINDYFAEFCRRYPGRFYANATLPFQDVDGALKELERARKDLAVKGIMMFSNIDGKPIASPDFYPLYAMAQEFDLPIFIHPAIPLTAEAMRKVRLPFSLYGFTLDTTMAVVSLIFQGIFETFPRLKVIHPHLGGVVPYLAGRMEDAFRSYAKAWGFQLTKGPSEYYKDHVYIDSISRYAPAMKCALEFVGPDHICFGTDYGHPVGNVERAVDYVKHMGLSEKDTNKILGDNADRIFRLNQ